MTDTSTGKSAPSDESLELSWLNWGFKGKGRDTFLFVLVLALLGVVVWLATFSLKKWGEPIDLKKTLEEQDEKLSKHRQSIKQEHDAFRRATEENGYILAVCLNPVRKRECQELQFDMPDSLKAKVRAYEH